jgi:Zn2+/Cd2+-exporting ATPase
MQVTSLLSRQDDESCASCGHDHHDHGHDHEHAILPLAQTLVGLVFIINSFVITWVLSNPASPIAAGSAMVGAIILGYPIVWTAIKDLRRGLLTTNELVALAVLAAFGSSNFTVGGYQQAGVIAFFMLMGQIIETRTAEGARVSIESLIKLTPPKARRVSAAGEEEVETKALVIGDVIRVRP